MVRLDLTASHRHATLQVSYDSHRLSGLRQTTFEMKPNTVNLDFFYVYSLNTQGETHTLHPQLMVFDISNIMLK